MTDAYAPPQSDVTGHTNSAQGSITEEMISALRGTKGWVRLFGILMFIAAAFMIIGAIGLMLGTAKMGMGGMMGASMGIMYLLMALLYVFPATYLVKYASAIGRLVDVGQAAEMESALQYQRKFWKFVGVLTLTMMVIAVVGIVAAIAIPMFAMQR